MVDGSRTPAGVARTPDAQSVSRGSGAPSVFRNPGAPNRLLALLPVALTLVILWAMMSKPGAVGTSSGPSPLAGASVLVVFVVTFCALSLGLLERLAAVALGAIACLALGALLGFYHPSDALRYLWQRHEPIVLVAGIRATTELLVVSGLFEHKAARLLRWSRGSPGRLMLGLCLATFALSMVLNNLATILVVIPLALRVTERLHIDPIPLVLGVVMASNLGGASTLVGDFPNMLIADQAGLDFTAFLIHLAPVCAAQMGVLLLFLTPAYAEQLPDARPHHARGLQTALDQMCRTPLSARVARRGLLILGAMVLGFMSCGWLGMGPGLVALAGGHMAMFAGGAPWRRVMTRDTLDDMLFFALLFLMVGAVAESGVLDGLKGALEVLWRGDPLRGALALCWCGAALTCFLNAGPSTALLIHLLPSWAGPQGWWALSLGVCAGSCGTLTGATAGPVTATLLEQRGHELTFNRFARTGVPVMGLLLATTSFYLVWAAR